MKNSFRRKTSKGFNPLSATFRQRSYAGQSKTMVTLDDALEHIERKNLENERRKARNLEKPMPNIDDRRKQLFCIASAIGHNPQFKKKVTLAKVSIQNSPME